MTEPSSNSLKVYREQSPEASRPDIESVAALSAVLRAFEEATGWSLRYKRGLKPTHPSEHAWSAPVNPGVGAAPGHATLDPVRSASAASKPRLHRRAAEQLAAAITEMLGELLGAQHAVWQREAELAASVPVVVRPGAGQHLAAKLESVLGSAGKSLSCDAAALYLLDEGTTLLKLRSSWGLPRQRLLIPPRPLRGALADLEAMLGHAVVLENAKLLSHWRPPEDFPSAACVPVATSSTILGTLWVFSSHPRGFDDRETEILEIIAGRMAAELERETLMREGTAAARLKHQFGAIEQFLRGQLPAAPPCLSGWEIAGWADPDPSTGGGLFDWFATSDGRIGTALLEAGRRGAAGNLSAVSARAALRAHALHSRNTATTLRRTGLTLWTASAGDGAVSAFYGLIDPCSDRLRFTAAGQFAVYVLGPSGIRQAPCRSVRLAENPESRYREATRRLAPKEALLVLAAGEQRDSRAPRGPAPSLDASTLARTAYHPASPARAIVEHFQRAIRSLECPNGGECPSILVLKRTNP